jgi:hypothetical protein
MSTALSLPNSQSSVVPSAPQNALTLSRPVPSPSSNAASAIVASAYAAARETFEEHLSEDDRKRLELGSANGMQDVQVILEKAATSYRSKSNSKARKWLSAFSSRITYYSGAMDLFAQADPQHTGLVWAAIKILLMVRSRIRWR